MEKKKDRAGTPARRTTQKTAARAGAVAKVTAAAKTLKTGKEAVSISPARVRRGSNSSDLVSRLRPPRPLEFRVKVRRPSDLVVFDLIIQNLKLSAEQPPRLIRDDKTKPSYLVVELPAQSFGERAFLDATIPEVRSDSPG